ncbi:juvenile hormone esterase-like [Vanessa cardui]|uniref:juvenile hormone esterase-like n=1 Tax=Vanessa cardui TaxID=171605 RepID=UPI001F12B619|nr:juvenile hormone esterase-like [Vanessa cardui]
MDMCNLLYLLLSRLIQVEVSEGILEGQVVANEYGCPFFSFKGIPYAEPPVGDLRFKAPQPKKPWQGVRDATEHGSSCFSFEMFTNETQAPEGSEDCLYLNVYAPNIAPLKPLPVMVYIHGGGFSTGNGDDTLYGPKFLVRKNVVVVTLNYRLEVLGFLSLDTEDVPGNAGMKDQVAALRWVKKNIKHFGGDPDNITIFGESAGGASVSFHLVSPMSKGLFKRAITQSGTLTSWWPNTFRPRDRGLLLAKQLGCVSTNDKEIYECLKTQPVDNLVQRKIPVTYVESSKEAPSVTFGIVQETKFGDNERFFYGHPFEVLRNGIHEGVEVMNGYTEDEGILFFSSGIDVEKVFDQANNFLEFFVPEPYTTYTPLATQMEIGRRFKDFYMKNKTASRDNLDDLLRYFNMELFTYGTISQEKIIAKKNQNKSYLYKFTCKSELNIFTLLTGLDQLFNYRPVVAHSDELGYIFSLTEINMNSSTFKMIEQVTTLWTNFAKYGDPTPDNSLDVKWLPYTLENQDYLDIGENLVAKRYPEKEDMEFWESNFKEFLHQYVP